MYLIVTHFTEHTQKHPITLSIDRSNTRRFVSLQILNVEWSKLQNRHVPRKIIGAKNKIQPFLGKNPENPNSPNKYKS